MKKALDFHGLKPEAAIKKLDSFVFACHKFGKPLTILLITGHGKTRDAIIKYLDNADILHQFEGENRGAILVHFNA
jgi:DNA-nicking Smr family endonuclease